MIQISIKKARELYALHKDFIMCASRLNPSVFGIRIDSFSFERMIDADFDILVNEFRYYNCTNKETGRTVKFYIED